MSSQKEKFGDNEVNKKTFYSSKEAILLDSVDLSKIVVSSRWKLNDTTYKYFCGYLNNNNNNNIVPIEKNHYICIPAIDIDSVLKIDKKAYPQAYLEECKYKLKKRKLVSFIDSEIIDDSDSDSDIDSHNNFSVPDSYIVM